MAGIAQVWLTEDELDFLVKATVRYVPYGKELLATRRTLLDKLRPLAYGVSCEVSAEGGASCILEGEAPIGACEGDLLTELK